MREESRFIAEDGTEFNTADACTKHEIEAAIRSEAAEYAQNIYPDSDTKKHARLRDRVVADLVAFTVARDAKRNGDGSAN